MKLSVVIPTVNRASLLARTIDLIESQTVPRDSYEVIVIDNNSTDGTREVLEQKAQLYPNLRFSHQSKPGAAPTRNVGIRLAAGDLVLFIDDDILAEPTLVEAHLRYHSANPNASIIGAIVTRWNDVTDPFLRYLRDRGIFNPYSLSGGPMDFSYYHTGNVSSPRAALVRTGGFDEDFTVYGMEDIELGYRLEKAGCRMIYGPDALATHHYFPTYVQFIERCEQAGYSLGRLLDLHPELRQRFVGNGPLARVLKRVHGLYRWVQAGVAPLVSVLNSWERRRGAGKVTGFVDLNFHWAVRYHIFLGYERYTRQTAAGHLRASPSPVQGFAIENRGSKLIP